MSDADDRKLQELIADLEQSIASFDERFSRHVADAPTVPVTTARRENDFPEIDVDARRPLEQSTAPEPPTNTPAPETDLLQELAAAANQRRSTELAGSAQREAAAEKIDATLRNAARYLQQLTEHVNVLQPEIPFAYAIDTRHRFDKLRWQESMVSFRNDNPSERSRLHSLTLRIKYAANDVILSVPEAKLEGFSREMGLINLVWREEEIVDIPGHGTGRSVTVMGQIPIQIALTPDLNNQRIVMRCRNLLGLGLSAFSILPEALDQATLDALARCLIGRGTKLPAHFRAVVAFDPQGNPR